MISQKSDYLFADWNKVDVTAECDGNIIPIRDVAGEDSALRVEDFAFIEEAFLRKVESGLDPEYIKALQVDTITTDPTPSKQKLKNILAMKSVFDNYGLSPSIFKGDMTFPSGWKAVRYSSEDRKWLVDALGSGNAANTSILPTAEQIEAMIGFDADIMRRFYRFIFGNNNCGQWRIDHYLSSLYFDSTMVVENVKSNFRFWGSYQKQTWSYDYSTDVYTPIITNHSFDKSYNDMSQHYEWGIDLCPMNNTTDWFYYSQVNVGYEKKEYYCKPISMNLQFGTQKDHDAEDVRVVMYLHMRDNVYSASPRRANYAKVFTPTRVGEGVYKIENFLTADEFGQLVSRGGMSSGDAYSTNSFGKVLIRDRDLMLPSGTNWSWMPT